MIQISVNGEIRTMQEPVSCQQLIEHMALAGKRFALERNGEIVPRSRLAQSLLADGDRLEIVIAVGGG